MLDRLIEAINKPIALDESSEVAIVGANIGITVFPTDSNEPIPFYATPTKPYIKLKNQGVTVFFIYAEKFRIGV